MKRIMGLFILLSQFLLVASGQQAFIVKNIEIQGLQRMEPATVKRYLPIKRGEVLQPAKTAAILQALYQTGFFEHITLSRANGTLIIKVVERPTIGELKISGNSVIPTDKLTTVMRTLDVAEGRIYDPATLEKIKQSLLNQYYQLGRYNARVDVYVSPMSRNRVSVKLVISEGLVAKIRRISIIGNQVFDEKTLIDQLDISTPGALTFFTQTDRYSEEKLATSLDKLRGYYMDHGYLRFEIKSSQAEITPDRKSVYITIVVFEGEQYTVERFTLSGKQVLPYDELVKNIPIKPGETFSRQKVLDAEKAITQDLGDRGYLFANIAIHPKVNDQTHQVVLIFEIQPGKRTYIRHITFSDNTRTNDVALRREIQQMEAAPASTSKLEDSKQRLSLLPYIKNVDMSVKPVSGVDDQVDVDYKVQEGDAGKASFKIGYSQIYRLTLGVGFDQSDFLGTGNTLGVNFEHSKYEQFYGIDYTNPYYTNDGISRSFHFSISRVDPRNAGLNIGYTTHEYDAGVLYGIPVGQELGVYSRIQAGVSYKKTLINLTKQVSNQINDFVMRHGTHYQELDMTLGFSRDSRDKAIFPTKGALQTMFLDAYAPLSQSSVSFYTLNYSGKWFQPVMGQFILLSRADLGYGNGFHGARDFPFFKNYLAGGIDSIRGYRGLTLGPRDSLGNPYGGNMLVDGSIGLIFPNYISDNLRTTVFLDAGNVYSSFDNRKFGGQSSDTGPIRYSTGIQAEFLIPSLGPITLSLATRLNRRPHDKLEPFQLALGANF